jgi:hypothetical protein
VIGIDPTTAGLATPWRDLGETGKAEGPPLDPSGPPFPASRDVAPAQVVLSPEE